MTDSFHFIADSSADNVDLPYPGCFGVGPFSDSSERPTAVVSYLNLNEIFTTVIVNTRDSLVPWNLQMYTIHVPYLHLSRKSVDDLKKGSIFN